MLTCLVYLDQLDHMRCTIQEISTQVLLLFDFPFDYHVSTILTSKFDFDFCHVFTVLNEIAGGSRATQYIGIISKTKTDSTYNGRLSTPVRTDHEVHVWAGEELCGRIGNKVLECHASDRARWESITRVRQPQKTGKGEYLMEERLEVCSSGEGSSSSILMGSTKSSVIAT